MPISSRVGLTHPESWHKVSEQGYLGLFFYRVRKKSSFEVLLVFFSTFSSQNLKYPTLMHWLASWVNPTSKTHIPCLPTTSQVPPVKFSLDSVALNFRPIWCHRPSLKHCESAPSLPFPPAHLRCPVGPLSAAVAMATASLREGVLNTCEGLMPLR